MSHSTESDSECFVGVVIEEIILIEEMPSETSLDFILLHGTEFDGISYRDLVKINNKNHKYVLFYADFIGIKSKKVFGKILKSLTNTQCFGENELFYLNKVEEKDYKLDFVEVLCSDQVILLIWLNQRFPNRVVLLEEALYGWFDTVAKCSHLGSTELITYVTRRNMMTIREEMNHRICSCDQSFNHKNITFTISKLIIEDEDVQCGVFTIETKLIFKTCSTRVFLFVQICDRFWDFDNYSEAYYDKCMEFLIHLFDMWKERSSYHDVTLGIFFRLVDKHDKNKYKDFYKIIIQNEKNDKYIDYLNQIRVNFAIYRKIFGKIRDSCSSTEIDDDFFEGIDIQNYELSSSVSGNLFELLNMNLNISCYTDCMDNSLDRTGNLWIIVTANSGYFSPDLKMYMMAKSRMNVSRSCCINYLNIYPIAAPCEIISLGTPPLHNFPLIKLQRTVNYKTKQYGYFIADYFNFRFFESNHEKYLKSYEDVDIAHVVKPDYDETIHHKIIHRSFSESYLDNYHDDEINLNEYDYDSSDYETTDYMKYYGYEKEPDKRFVADRDMFTNSDESKELPIPEPEQIPLNVASSIISVYSSEFVKFSSNVMRQLDCKSCHEDDEVDDFADFFHKIEKLLKYRKPYRNSSYQCSYREKWLHSNWKVADRKILDVSVDWNILCCPMLLPLSVDFVFKKQFINQYYDVFSYHITLTNTDFEQEENISPIEKKELLKQRLKKNFYELFYLRLILGFQFIENEDNFEKDLMACNEIPEEFIVCSNGDQIHSLSLFNGYIHVQRYARRHYFQSKELFYNFCLQLPDMPAFVAKRTVFRMPNHRFINYNHSDHYIANFDLKDFTFSKCGRYERKRILILPKCEKFITKIMNLKDDERCDIYELSDKKHLFKLISNFSEFIKYISIFEFEQKSDVQDKVLKTFSTVNESNLKEFTEFMIKNMQFVNYKKLPQKTFVSYVAVDFCIRYVDNVHNIIQAVELLHILKDENIIFHISKKSTQFNYGFYLYTFTDVAKTTLSFNVECVQVKFPIDENFDLQTFNMKNVKVYILLASNNVSYNFDPKGTSQQKQYGVLEYIDEYNPRVAYEIEMRWIMACGLVLKAMKNIDIEYSLQPIPYTIHYWNKKAVENDFHLILIPTDPFYLSPDLSHEPFRSCFEIDCQYLNDKEFECVNIIYFISYIFYRYGFLGFTLMPESQKYTFSYEPQMERYMCHISGGMFVRFTVNPIRIYWSWNSILTSMWKNKNTGDIEFQDKMLDEIRKHFVNYKSRLSDTLDVFNNLSPEFIDLWIK
ncbi:hypothetical protein A3Q56_03823 [Intoshia linei]|uniref:DEP domain-containing protein n=1 Tax=Intoshia linei TaxID=1819745 RepID=A0A177B4E6_9BILA|nr:hypothetical protein A3Q56_03823 [Intoshia linei]